MPHTEQYESTGGIGKRQEEGDGGIMRYVLHGEATGSNQESPLSQILDWHLRRATALPRRCASGDKSVAYSSGIRINR